MKILYGVQGTGNGHITRSMQIIDLLRKSHQVDVLVSGDQNSLCHLLRPKYTFKGFRLSFKKDGRIDHLKTLKNSDFRQFATDIKSVDFSRYDLVVSDFEPVSAYGAKISRIPSLGISNQNYIKKTTRNPIKRMFLNYFSPTDSSISIHFFENPEKNVFGPITDLKLSRNTMQGDHVLVYLPHFPLHSVTESLKEITLPENVKGFKVFHPEVKSFKYVKGNIVLYPINRTGFVTEIKKCFGIITNCGFSTVSESLYLKKKLWAIPIKNQFEQKFNARKLEKKGYFTSGKISQKLFDKWIKHEQPSNYEFENSAQNIVSYIETNYQGVKLKRVG